jgi:hypothetical protein
MPIDLFSPQVEEFRFHRNFRSLLHRAYEHARLVLTGWAKDFVDRDGKFVLEFQTTFNSSFWELYVFACLKDLGLKVDFSFPAPDFIAHDGKHRFCVEATTSNSAEGSPAEWEVPIEEFWGELHSVKRLPLIDQASIRLANTIVSKHRKYRNSYDNLRHVKGLPFVLAIAPFDQPFFFVQNDQAIQRVLFGYDGSVYERAEPEARPVGRHKFIKSIQKPNGADIELGYFTNQGMKEISAVVFSNTATVGKLQALNDDPNPHVLFRVFRVFKQNPDYYRLRQEVFKKNEYQETLLDGLHVFYNPFAAYPLDPAIFNKPRVMHHSVNLEKLTIRNEIADGSLMQRLVAAVVPKE